MMPTATASARPTPQLLLQVALIIVSVVATWNALTAFPAFFIDFDHSTRVLDVAQRLIKARLAIAPVIAIAALVCAGRGWLRHAIVALAALLLVVWVTELPSVFIHGLELGGGLLGLTVFARRFLYPVMAVAAIVLAVRNERLVLAGILVCLPTVLAMAGVVAFAITIMIYGF